jgi:hypothetical protein
MLLAIAWRSKMRTRFAELRACGRVADVAGEVTRSSGTLITVH